MIPTTTATVTGVLDAVAPAPGALDSATIALQATATGGSPVVVVLALLGVAVATGLSLLIAYEALRGYRGSNDTGMLLLAVGIVCLTATPNTLRVVLPTFTGAPESLRLLLATGSELLGLACILLAIYGRPRQ